MVSVAQARASIQAQQQLVASQRQQIQQRTTQASLTAAQVRQQTRSSIAQRQVEFQKLSSVRKKALATLDPISKRLDEASRQVSSVESQIRKQTERFEAFKSALDKFRSGDPRAAFFLSGLEQEFFRKISAGKTTAIRLEFERQTKELEKVGLAPIFVNGELKGISDFIKGQSRTLGELESILISGKLVGFRDIALQLSRPIKVPIPIEVVRPPRVVLPGETNIEQLVRNIKESRPEFAFVKNEDIRKALIKATPPGIAQLKGLEKFSVSKFKQTLSDPTGVFKFTPIQSERIGDITKEIVSGFALGVVAGKAITLIRGAGAKFLPKALKESPKFQKATSVLGGGTAIILTGAAGISIGKTFEQEGIDAAILQTIGLISFGAGFSVTGLKSLPRAEKEFKQITDLLKKVVPSGKRGEARFDELGRFLKKKKGGRFGELEQLDAEDVRKGREALAAIEKRIAQAKTPKEQAKILAELKKRLKTPQEKKNFETFVLGLVEKNIIKLPKIEIVPGVKVKVFPIKKGITVFLPKRKTPGRIREEKRVTENKLKNQKRIARSKLSLGEKFKLAQAGLVEVGLTSAQRIKQEQKRRQKLILRQRTETITRQREGLRLILRQRSISKLKLKQLLRNSFKTTLKIKKPLLKKLRVLPPLIPFPKKKVKKKVFKKIPEEISKIGYNAFVKVKGKFKRVNIRPITKSKARDLGAFVVDQSLGATFKIVKTKRTAKTPKVKAPRNYFGVTKDKYRSPIRKGKKIPVKNLFIEKRKFRLDTLREVKKIQAARLIADLRKKAQKRIKPFKFKRV